MEDSPPELDRELVGAYLRTDYQVLIPAFNIKIGALPPEVGQWLADQNFTTFAFLTAANPKSILLPEHENRTRNETLLRELLPRVPASPRPAVHRSAHNDWPPEPSWWVPGLLATDAVRLGLEFEQNALVFWQKGGAVELWWL